MYKSILAFGAVLIALLFTLYFLGNKFMDNFREKVETTTIFTHEPARKIVETATSSKKMTVQHTYTTNWKGSVKKIELTGQFIAKAGYTHHSFELSNGLLILKRPSLLSCELTSVDIGEDGGIWNWVKDEDREAAFAGLISKAREQAKNSDLMERAEEGASKIVNEYADDFQLP